MESTNPTDHDLAEQVAELQIRLEEANETLDAIRNGEVDAVIGAGPQGDLLFTLKGADNAYRVLIEEMNQGAITLSAKGAILYCNRRFCELLKLPLEEVLGADFIGLVALAERDEFHALLQTGRTRADAVEITLTRGDGEAAQLQLSVAPLPAGSAAAICLIATDISESKRVEAELMSREARLTEAQKLAHIGSWEEELQTGKLTWSDELFRIYRLDRATFIPSDNDTHLIHPDDRGWAMERVQVALAANGAFEHDHRILRADGTVGVVQARGRIVLDQDGKPLRFVGTTQDITERKAVEAALEVANDKLRQVSRQAGMAEVATSVLHNVGNVLNSVNISATLVSEKIRKSCSSDITRVAELFERNAYDLATFVSSPKGIKLAPFLSSVAKHLAEEQRSVLAELKSLSTHIDHIKEIVAMQQTYARIAGVTETLPLASLIEDALQIHAAALERRRVEVVRDYDATIVVEVDKHKALQILVNLIGNAKYAMDGPGARGKRMTIRVGHPGPNRATISVEDEGVGIAPDNLTRIFSHGFTTRKDGHGFGLHSAALAAKEMGGSLTVVSKGTGLGAVFSLELPLSAPPSRPPVGDEPL